MIKRAYHWLLADPVLHWKMFWIVVIISWGLLFCYGCTIAPRPTIEGSVSYVGNVQNSGMLGRDPKTGSEIVDPAVKDRYDALAAIYGSKFAPPIKPDAGFTAYTNGTYLLTAQGLHNYLELCVLKRNNK